MLRVFFFVVAYLTDYRAAAEAMHGGLTLGLVNAAVVCLIAGSLAVRGWMKRVPRC
ncbi:MAG TPA: hypothetical protein VE077_21300 [Candidatus Methylomirabilis sp.]|nr:hypothetical protein [Candidatus Methylomirabilis sp.]